MTRLETDLILHPLRYRLLQTLLGEHLTTAEISQKMPDVPVSSLYRHLKTLLDSGLVQVVNTRRVKGIDEKIYTAGELHVLQEEDFQAFNSSDRQRYFASYLSYLYKRFSDFITSEGIKNMEEERAGFTDIQFYATPEEMDEFSRKLHAALEPLRKQDKTPQRQRQIFSVITFPVERKEE